VWVEGIFFFLFCFVLFCFVASVMIFAYNPEINLELEIINPVL